MDALVYTSFKEFQVSVVDELPITVFGTLVGRRSTHIGEGCTVRLPSRIVRLAGDG